VGESPSATATANIITIIVTVVVRTPIFAVKRRHW
jgi:hypothetical protein